MVQVGDRIKIITMVDAPDYTDKEGIVTCIDSFGQIHGTWGNYVLIEDFDKFEVISKKNDT